MSVLLLAAIGLLGEGDYDFVRATGVGTYAIGKYDHFVTGDLEGRILPKSGYEVNLEKGDRGMAAGRAWFIRGPLERCRFEFRSARLVPGAFNLKAVGFGSTFVPEIGGVIADFTDYRYSASGPLIYNLPGFFQIKDLLGEKKRIQFAPSTPRGPDPTASSRPAPTGPAPTRSAPFRAGPIPAIFATRPAPKPYVNPPKEQFFSYFLGGVTYYGFIDEYGDFIFDPELPWPKGKLEKPPYPEFMTAKKAGEPVFEYRSGRLIPGHMSRADSDGEITFIPELGAKVIEYKPDLPALKERRIYNLPFHLRK